MTKSKFRFDPDIPDLVRYDIQGFFEPFESLIPVWCNSVCIGFTGGGCHEPGYINSVAITETHYQYRWARITVYGRWVDQTHRFKLEVASHELLHICTNPIKEWIEGVINHAVRPKQRALLLEQLAMYNEMITEDIAQVALKLFPAKSERQLTLQQLSDLSDQQLSDELHR